MTPAGRGTLFAGLAISALGLVSGYPAVTALGATLVVAVAIALLTAGRRVELAATRRIRPDRVTMGDPAHTELTITNEGRRNSGAGKVFERVGDTHVALDLPPLDPRESTVITHVLPTEQRGVFAIGPLTVRRGDPIGLVRRGKSTSDQGTLIVHPEVHQVSPFPAGLRRDLEGLPSGEAAEGGISFSSLREYVPGDDLRLVHWRSSAHVGELMVRHNIDVHRPSTSVILDTTRDVYDEESFEDAVRAAASVIVAAMTRRFPFALRTLDGAVIDDRSSRLAVMDFFATIEPTDRPAHDLGSIALRASRGPSGLSCATITGRAGVETLQSLGPLRNRFEQLTMVRMGSDQRSQVYELAGAVLMNTRTSADFAHAWNRRMRR